MTIELCPARAEDEEFLFAVYASTRASEMALVPWSVEEKEAFLRMQSRAQRSHYAIHYPQAGYFTIQRDDLPIGRMIVDRTQDPILLMDIALLPEYRTQGIGTALIRELMAEAAGRNRGLMLHVEIFNPARRLYERLGFVKTGEIGIYQEMTWRPEAK